MGRAEVRNTGPTRQETRARPGRGWAAPVYRDRTAGRAAAARKNLSQATQNSCLGTSVKRGGLRVCVCVCVHVRVHACACACVCVWGGNCANSLGNKVFNLRDTSMQPDSQEIRPQIGNISSISRCILFLKICCFFFTQTQKDKYSVIPPLLRSPGLSDSQRQKQVGGRGRAGAGRTCQTGTECRFEKMSRSWRRRR